MRDSTYANKRSLRFNTGKVVMEMTNLYSEKSILILLKVILMLKQLGTRIET